MQANKITFTIEIITLSIDSVPAILVELAKNIKEENTHGLIRKLDGNQIKWSHELEKVIF